LRRKSGAGGLARIMPGYTSWPTRPADREMTADRARRADGGRGGSPGKSVLCHVTHPPRRRAVCDEYLQVGRDWLARPDSQAPCPARPNPSPGCSALHDAMPTEVVPRGQPVGRHVSGGYSGHTGAHGGPTCDHAFAAAWNRLRRCSQNHSGVLSGGPGGGSTLGRFRRPRTHAVGRGVLVRGAVLTAGSRRSGSACHPGRRSWGGRDFALHPRR